MAKRIGMNSLLPSSKRLLLELAIDALLLGAIVQHLAPVKSQINQQLQSVLRHIFMRRHQEDQDISNR